MVQCKTIKLINNKLLVNWRISCVRCNLA